MTTKERETAIYKVRDAASEAEDWRTVDECDAELQVLRANKPLRAQDVVDEMFGPEPAAETVEDFFGPAVFTYTCENAVDDGVLVHPYPEQYPWLLVTATVNELAKTVADCRGAELKTVLVPLMIDAVLAARRAIKSGKGSTLLVLDHTAVGTVWIAPNEKGGLTVMKPEDH